MGKEIGIIIGGIISDLRDIDREDVSIHEGVRIVDAGQLAVELEAAGAKAIVSTGGTAPVIEKHVKIPVIHADPTYFDLLETLRDMEQAFDVSNEQVALILHISRSIVAERLQPFLHNNLSLFKYRDEDHLREIIKELFTQDFKVVVGGPTTLHFAKQLGILAYPLALGRETMISATERARFIVNLIQKDREQTQRLKTVLDVFPDGILATDREGIVTMCNPRALAILHLDESQVIGKKVYQVTADPSWIDVYQKGARQSDVIREFRKSKIFTTRQPIIVNDQIIGAVGTFQEAAKIEKLEHQYRKAQTLGLVAKYRFENILGNSSLIRETIQKAKAYARSGSTVLIEGETGTGKEMFAQSIHNASERRHGPFVAINCAALPETLLESELMGYEEGAFTGAKRGGKAGLFELAHKGTIFLDEINQLPLPLQARVLRVIQEKVVLRLGGERVVPVDVHIIAATNESLATKVKQGQFRDDLFYRINILNLRLPPLRERLEDIPLLLEYFMRLFYGVSDQEMEDFASDSIEIMLKYHWPGNVRELANFVERFAVLKKQVAISESEYVKAFTTEKVSADLGESNCGQDLNTLTIAIGTLESMERQLIEQVIERCSGNKVLASLMLGISRTTIWNKVGKKE